MRINWRIGSYFNISIQRTFDFFEMFLEKRALIVEMDAL